MGIRYHHLPLCFRFPCRMPQDDVWRIVPLNAGSALRRRRALRMMVHLVVLGLNYVHFSAPLQIVRYLRRRPSDLHLGVYERLLALIKAGGPLEEINVLNCGRKSHQLDARLDELLEALQKNGLHNITSYAGLSEKTVVPPCNDREELRPYRDLDASRLKLSGSGAWDPGDYLSDLFYLPYVEPRINQFNIIPPFELLQYHSPI